MVAGEWGRGEGGQRKVQTSRCKINKFWGYNVQNSDYNMHRIEHCTVYLKVAKGVDLKSSHHSEKKL